VNGDRGIRELWHFGCEGYIGKLTREHAEKEAALEAELEVTVDGETIPFRMLRPAMANEPDRDKRERIDRVRVELTEEHLNPLYAEGTHIVREGVERLEAPRGMTRAYAAGAVAALMVAAVTLLFRYTFLLIGIAPLLWAAAALAIIFGLACLGLYAGRRLARRLGAAHPLLAALAGILLILDAALVPYLGWLFAAAAALIGLGLAALTRFGSPHGWSLEDLRFDARDTTPEEA
jgi:hypothetical protein